MGESTDSTQTQASDEPMSEEELVRLIAERVWELLQEDLRKEKERRGD
ncbi:MAG: hypothetical protein JXB47_05135 [Anaerolineae bacterium]|nr:hypothetical protein [Anaerolineae bacterium]